MLSMFVVTGRLVSREEAAENLGVSVGAVERYTARGRLTAWRGYAGVTVIGAALRG
jgi:excisionase family DNA binding protein